ncbi:MAG: hypothetical protein KGI25_09095 [Thaumarchaeota archaeon]|nr:hypothetical protein [Nitrososphaerota archaeon]
MTTTYFWTATSTTLVLTFICFIINNALFKILGNLIYWLYLSEDSIKKLLIRNGEPDKARKITTDEVPKLIIWYDECKNYGLINLVGLVSAIGLMVFGGIYHELPYIVIVASVIFLVSNLFFLPRAFKRLNQTIEINNGYVLFLKAFEQANEIKTDGT